jgi:hypothetical protein
MKLFSELAKEIFNDYTDFQLEEFLGVDLQVVWQEMGESEDNYEEEVLELIEEKLTDNSNKLKV